MILLHSVDVYQHIHVLWTKYCTELDSLDPLQCNNTVFVGIVWISGLSGGFICEFLQFCYCLFGWWWSDKDTDCICCVDCILKCILVENHRRRVLRAKEEGDLPACYQRSVQKPASLMVWGCISAYGMGSLHVLEATMNAERYIKVLEQHMLPPPDDVYLRESLVYFSRTMQHHILQLLQQHGFVVEESGC